MIEIDEEDFQLQFPKYSNFLSGLKSDDQFPKLHLSAKLGKLSGSVCTYEGSMQMTGLCKSHIVTC